MEEISINDLDSYVKSYKEDKLLAIVLWTRYCPKCEPFIERINHIKDDFDHLHFVSSEIDDIPLFAPPGTPAVIMYYKGVRELEHVGDLDIYQLCDSMSSWYGYLIRNIRKIDVDNYT